MVMILARQRMLQRACLASTLRVTLLRPIRFKSTGPSTPLGLKDASKMEPLSGNMKLILGYITFGVVAMATIARVRESPKTRSIAWSVFSTTFGERPDRHPTAKCERATRLAYALFSSCLYHLLLTGAKAALIPKNIRFPSV